MRLDSIHLQNIRSYKDQKIDFPSGTSLFEGDIGSGKSTILMAIEFALFGLGSQKGASLLQLGEKEGSVSLAFSVNGNSYEISRSLIRGKKSVRQKNKGILHTQQGDIPLSPGELKERILEVLNFKEPAAANAQSVIYRYAVFTPQEEMKAILRDKQDRIQTLRKAFGLEDYKIAADNGTLLSNRMKDKANQLRGEIKDLPTKKKELEEFDTDFAELDKEKKELATKKNKLEKLQKKQESILEKLRNKEKKYDEANSKIPLIQNDVEGKLQEINESKQRQSELKDQIEKKLKPKIEELSELKKPTSKSKTNLESLRKKLRKLENEENGLESQKPGIVKRLKKVTNKVGDYKSKTPKEVEMEIEKLEKKKKDIELKLSSFEKQLENIRKRKTKLELQKEELEGKVEEAKSLKGLCPVCERKLSKDHRKHLEEERYEKLSQVKTELPKSKEEEEEIKSQMEQSKKERDDIKKEINKLDTIREKLEDLNEDTTILQDIEKRLTELEKKLTIKEEKGVKGLDKFENPSEYIEKVIDALIEYQSSQDKIKQYKDSIQNNSKEIKRIESGVKKKTRALETTKKRLERLKSTRKKLEKIPQQAQSLDDEIYERQKEIDNLRDMVGNVEGRRKELRDRKNNLKKEIDKKTKAKDNLDKIQEYYNWLTEYLIPTLKVIEKQVMMTIKQEFESVFQKWYSKLVDDPDKEAIIDEDFAPSIIQDGYDQDVDYLSGGERTSLAFAYRLALNTIVQKISTGMKSNLLILDEPTDGFSKSQLFKVRDVLAEINSPQLIMVSHETELENFADKIFEVTKSNGISQIITR